MMEAGLRPAVLKDPVQRLRTGKPGEPRRLALRSTAARYAFANRYDEFTSLENSRIEARPHQISVAYRVVSSYPHRFLLCDEVGLGKTIEAGMVLKELRARRVAKRVLVLVPTSLLSQWQFEPSKYLLSPHNTSVTMVVPQKVAHHSDSEVRGIYENGS
jgi:ATP-dependent helicase HepA